MNEQPPRKSPVFATLVGLAGLSLAYTALLRPKLLRWGTRHDEARRRLLGDDLILHPQTQMTLAMNIEAPPEVVWLWLSRRSLPRTEAIRPAFPEIAVGMRLENGLKVLAAEPAAALVLGKFGFLGMLNTLYDVTFAYLLEKHSPEATRLLCRLRLYAYGVHGLVFPRLAEPIFFAQLFTQLHRLRRHAEASSHLIALSKGKSNGNMRVLLEN